MPLNALEGDYCDHCYAGLPIRDKHADDMVLAFLWWVDDVSTADNALVIVP